MTDDKAAGEGPYKHSDYHRTTRAHAVSCSACAYAAGRKAERERCAKIAQDYLSIGRIIAAKIRGGQDGE